MKPTAKDTRVVEVFASSVGTKITLTFRSWWHKLGTAERRDQETRMVRCVVPVPLTNDDLIKYAEAMARFCVEAERALAEESGEVVAVREVPVKKQKASSKRKG